MRRLHAARTQKASSTQVWGGWLVATLFFVYSVVSSVLFALLSGDIQNGLDLGPVDLGALSAALFASLALGQLFAGTLADRVDMRILLSVAAAVSAIGTFLFAATAHPLLAAVGRIIAGLGMSFAFVGAAFVARVWFPSERYAFMVGLSQMFANVASALLAVLFAQFLSGLGYRQVFMGMGILGVIIAILCLSVLREPPSQEGAPDSGPRMSPIEAWRSVLLAPQIWLGGIYFGLFFGVLLAFADLWNMPLQLSFGNTLARAAEVNAGIPFGVAIGSVVAGWFAGRNSGPLPPARTFAWGAALAMVGILALPPLPSFYAMLLHLVFGFFMGGSVLAFAIVASQCPPQTQGTAIGFVTTLGYVGGALLQTAIGEQLERIPKPDSAAYIDSFWILPGALVLAALLAWALRMGVFSETTEGGNVAG